MIGDYVRLDHDEHLISGTKLAGLMVAVLEKKAYFRFTAPGFSMTPFIRDGDVITLAHLPAKLFAGDVVAFMEPCNRRLTVHRIIKVLQAGYLIKGDNATEPDGVLEHSSLIGHVVRVERHGSRVLFGAGVEGGGIAWLSHRGWLIPLVQIAWRILRAGFRNNMQ